MIRALVFALSLVTFAVPALAADGREPGPALEDPA